MGGRGGRAHAGRRGGGIQREKCDSGRPVLGGAGEGGQCGAQKGQVVAFTGIWPARQIETVEWRDGAAGHQNLEAGNM